MWRRLTIAGATVGLLLGASSALAFEQTPEPPPAGSDAATSAPQKPTAAPFQLGTANAPAVPDERKGLNVFGYNVFPKLNFGLDVLYGQEEQQLELQQGPSTIEENGDVTVFGKVKRRF